MGWTWGKAEAAGLTTMVRTVSDREVLGQAAAARTGAAAACLSMMVLTVSDREGLGGEAAVARTGAAARSKSSRRSGGRMGHGREEAGAVEMETAVARAGSPVLGRTLQEPRKT